MKKKHIRLLALLLIIICAFVGCSKQSPKTLSNEMNMADSSLEGQSLKEYVAVYPIPENVDAYLKSYKMTLDNVKEQVAMDKSLVLFEGVVGGKPFILLESVRLIDQQLLYCEAEDGHISGALLIEFTINEDQSITFDIYARDINESGIEIVNE